MDGCARSFAVGSPEKNTGKPTLPSTQGNDGGYPPPSYHRRAMELGIRPCQDRDRPDVPIAISLM